MFNSKPQLLRSIDKSSPELAGVGRSERDGHWSNLRSICREVSDWVKDTNIFAAGYYSITDVRSGIKGVSHG
ncbi:MAG: hypothetical protein ACI8TP_001879 [Acidimicrobiales bacterium]|jgi:hypothetical protein